MGSIQDGTGKGFSGKIGSDNRFWTDSVIKTKSQDGSLNGRSYNINTGSVTLTSANKSALLYVVNNGTADLVIETLFYLIGNSTGGSGNVIITVLRNPTAGTIISGASNCEMAGINRNFGSNNTLTASMYKGAEASTFTDGTKVIESIFNQAATRAAIDVGYIVLKKGNSIGIDITPATGNTSLNVEFAMNIFERENT